MIRIEVPATSANCCLGFDCMGLALDWKARFDFEESEQLIIEGCKEEFCNEDNLVIQAFWKTAEYLGRERKNVHLIIDSNIPFARGLGSSATCILAGIVAATYIYQVAIAQEDLLNIALEIEGHMDNLLPAFYGGLICAFEKEAKGRKEYIYQKAALKRWKLLALIPDYPIETAKARTLLPESISLSSAAEQVGRALVFWQALEKAQMEKALAAAKDALHEPYRKVLIKEYEALQAYCQKEEILLWISGSGSSMLALSLTKAKLDKLKAYAREHFPEIMTRDVRADMQGLYVEVIDG